MNTFIRGKKKPCLKLRLPLQVSMSAVLLEFNMLLLYKAHSPSKKEETFFRLGILCLASCSWLMSRGGSGGLLF